MSGEVAVNVPAAILFVVIVLAIVFVVIVALTRERPPPPPPPKGQARSRFKVGVYVERGRKSEELEPWDVDDTLELPPR